MSDLTNPEAPAGALKTPRRLGTSAASMAWLWITTLYFAESLPNAVVSDTSTLFYTDMGMNAIDLGVITGSMYFAWVLKPFWGPLVDIFKTKRWWIVFTQLLLAGCFFGLGYSMHLDNWRFWTAACLWGMAFTSATHDIAADGFYMLGLDERVQAGYNGIRSTCYRLGMLTAKGFLVAFAGHMATSTGSKVQGWSQAMYVPAIFYLVCAVYHFLVLPRPARDVPAGAAPEEVSPSEPGLNPTADAPGRGFLEGYVETFTTFFSKPRIASAIAFMLLFRFAEAQVLAMVAPFLKGSLDQGGLGLSTEQVGVVYGTFGALGIIVGGISGGVLVAALGLRRTFWPMICIMHVPNVVFLLLATTQPGNTGLISAALFTEQFGYGFGFTVYTLYLIYFSRGPLSTSHYAVCTGFMAMSTMFPKMISGYIKTALGFQGFFVYILLATLPSFLVAYLAWRDRDFIDYFQPKAA